MLCYHSITKVANTLEDGLALEDKKEVKLLISVESILIWPMCENGMDRNELEKKNFSTHTTKDANRSQGQVDSCKHQNCSLLQSGLAMQP